ncbi:hypothetical protein ABW21_db0209538 [Orbilia brochopaga]|nr:hypothetical protein ABW21_db0209538 [Drechslerella brochopaga]
MQPAIEKTKDATGSDDSAMSTLTLAFASFVLLNKPPELSATEFIYYLRGCVQKDLTSKTGHLRHLSNETYWRNVCRDKDSRILDLDQKLIDATIENNRLAEQLKRKRDDDDVASGDTLKKAKVDQVPLEDISQDPLIKWQPVPKTYENLSSDTAAAKRRMIDAAWVADVTHAIDDVFRRLLMAITRLQSTCSQLDSCTHTSIASAVTDLVCEILESFHLASQAYANFNPSGPDIRARDIRSGVTTTLQSFLSTLAATSTNNSSTTLPAEITENILFIITEAAGKCLCMSAGTSTHASHAIEKAARKQTAGYILELLRVAVPIYRDHVTASAVDGRASPILEITKRRFHDAVMKGLFGNPTETPSWSDLTAWAKEAAADGFAEEVWKLLDLDDFALVW